MNDYINIPTTEPARQQYFMDRCHEYIEEIISTKGKAPTFYVSTFGCQMNARDSEKLTGILEKIGYTEASAEDKADFVIYNTCTVRENANQKLYGHLGSLKKKKESSDMMIGICGCMMQQPDIVEHIKESFGFVDLVFGTFNFYKLAELLYMRLSGEKKQVIEVLAAPEENVEHLPEHKKYSFKSGVNIMYGCNNFCTYCIVPYVRGRERSRAPEDIIAEVKCLASEGFVEIMLLGQNVNSYGKGLDDEVSFPELLKKVEAIDGLERIRFMTSHPKDLSDELIKVMAESKKICKHIHLPLQSGSSEVLRRMNRRYTKEQYLALVDKIRAAMPDIAITTDIIVGFPGETYEDVLETVDVIKKAQFDNAFTFIYSKRTGTPAASMEDQVDEETVKKHFDLVLSTVQEMARKRTKRFESREVTVLCEGINEQDASYLDGRMSENTIVHFKGDKSLIGTFKKVKLTEFHGFYYDGVILE